MQPPPLPNRVPPVVLVSAHAKPVQSIHAVAEIPLFEDKARLLMYGKWGGLALLALLVLSAMFGGEEPANDNSYSSSPAVDGGSYEDRMNAGIAELGGTYDSSSGTMTTNR